MQRMPSIAPFLCAPFLIATLAVCGSNSATHSGVTTGAADAHCVGKTPQEANVCICESVPTSGDNPCTGTSSTNMAFATHSTGMALDDNGTTDGMTNEYGDTMYGAEGDDDDCKYHVKWSASDVVESKNVTFTVAATKLVENAPLTGAAARAEVFLDDTHPAPYVAQTVVENPPGTYSISPVKFDASGKWTVRFHFYELCNDTQDNSEHGHAAFYVTVP